ncbi:MAG: serine acetyltransferase [Enterococcus sp.]|uniref:serine acetyltransferase n=1 Tax=Enterococcus sp. TaxID=35783 RepID=UPI002FC70B25
METMTFEELLEINCYSKDESEKAKAVELLEKWFGCEIQCEQIDRSVLFAHHARGCTIVAAKLSQGVVIYQNVTLGSNMRYNNIQNNWENMGSPILAENVIVADGAKILGPVTIGKNTVVGAGAIITKDIPENSIAFGVNQYKSKNPAYDLVFKQPMPSGEEIIEVDRQRIREFDNQ